MRRDMIFCLNLLLYFKFSSTNDIRTIRKRSVDLAALAALPQGSELYTLENIVDKTKSYQFEDFFWTGSGDGGYEDHFGTNFPDLNHFNTIYTTKTIFSTIYIDSSTSPTSPTAISNQSEVINVTCPTCTTGDDISGGISPTPTVIKYPHPNEEADAQYWIVTVLKSDVGEKQQEPVLEDIRNGLAKLYQIAFERQQKYHLTGENLRSKRQDKATVRVTIHKFGNTSEDNGKSKMEIVYHVSLYGEPVDPITASADMSLVSDDEMQQELGYPFWIKAEPYIKVNASQQKANAGSSWLVISIVIASVLVLLVAVALLSFCLTTRKQRGEHVQQIVVGGSNRSPNTPTYVNYGCTESEVEHHVVQTRQNSPPLMVASFPDVKLENQQKNQQKIKNSHHYRPRAAINRTVPLNTCVMTEVKPDHHQHKNLSSSTSSCSSSGSSSSSSTISSNVPTPTSYLSMPSVKEFPYSSSGHPEPLSRVLEPVSVQHLDHLDHVDVSPITTPTPLPRSHSLATASDPGVINPMVWQWKEEQHGGNVSVSRMRQRLNNLLDDTFSLFGATDGQSGRSQSAVLVNRRQDSNTTCASVKAPQRPTSCVAAPPTTNKGFRRGAWEDIGRQSPRPGSAPILVDAVQVQAQGRISPSDPALPLIKAIKTEIGKCNRNN